MDAVAAVEVSAVALKETSEKVTDLAVQVAVLAAQHEHVLITLNRLELTLRDQSASTGEYRAALQQQIGEVADSVRTVETRLETVVAEVAQLADRNFGAWLRRYAPVIGVAVTVLTAIVFLVRWLIVNYQ